MLNYAASWLCPFITSGIVSAEPSTKNIQQPCDAGSGHEKQRQPQQALASKKLLDQGALHDHRKQHAQEKATDGGGEGPTYKVSPISVNRARIAPSQGTSHQAHQSG